MNSFVYPLRVWCLLLVATITLHGAPTSQALDNFWTGAVNADWHDVRNWEFRAPISPLPRVPNEFDSAVIGEPSGDIVRLSADTGPIRGLIVGNGIGLLNRTTLSAEGYEIAVENNGFGGTAITGSATVSLWPDTGGLAAILSKELDTETLLMTTSGALLLYDGSQARVDGQTTMTSSSRISNNFAGGAGTMLFAGNVSMDAAVLDLRGSMGSDPFSGGTMVTASNGSSIWIDRLQAFSESIELVSGTFLDVTNNTFIGTTARLEVVDSIFHSGGSVQVDGGIFKVVDDQGTSTFTLPAGESFSASNDALIEFGDSLDIGNGQTYTLRSGADLVSSGLFPINVGDSIGTGVGTLVAEGAGTTLDVRGLDIGANVLPEPMVTIRDQAHATMQSLSIATNATSGAQALRGQMIIDAEGSVHVSANVTIGTNNELGGGGILALAAGGSLTQFNTGSTTLGKNGSGYGHLFVYGGSRYVSGTGPFEIRSSGTLAVSRGSTPGRVEINGPLTVQGEVDAMGILEVNAPMTIEGGTVELSDGEMHVESVAFAGGGEFNFTGGKLSVGIYNGSLTNGGGTLAPGDSAGNTTIVGDYVQQSDGAIELEIGGTGMGTTYDFVQVSGNAILDGELLLGVIDGFVPDAADTFLVLSAGDLLGVFDNIANGQRLDTFDGFGSFQVNYGINSSFDPDQIVLSDFQITDDADLDNDGDVDGFDFLVIQRDFPSLIPLWRQQYGAEGLVAVPEPADSGLIFTGLALFACLRNGART